MAKETNNQITKRQVLLLILLWSLVILFIYIIGTTFAADVNFALGTSSGSIGGLATATNLNPSEETYHRNLGLALAVTAKTQEDAALKQGVAEAADDEFKKAIALNSKNMLTLKAAVIGYNELQAISSLYLPTVQELTKMIRTLSPSDPSGWYEAAKVEAALGNISKAKEYAAKVVELKGDPTAFPALPGL